MAFLLDTNVVSETLKRRPQDRVLQWLSSQLPANLFLASTSLGELVRGARRLQDLDRRRRLEDWIDHDLAMQFTGRILAFDQTAAVLWGEIMGDGDRMGRPRSAADAQIAAVARRHGLTLATRNIKDFADMGVQLFDPWEA